MNDVKLKVSDAHMYVHLLLVPIILSYVDDSSYVIYDAYRLIYYTRIFDIMAHQYFFLINLTKQYAIIYIHKTLFIRYIVFVNM